MRITFLLPGSSEKPTGGAKVVYEYANRLTHRGHEITIIQSPVVRKDWSVRQIAKAAIRYPQRKWDKRYRPDTWFDLDRQVTLLWAPSFAEKYVPQADVVIATAWKTAEWASDYAEDRGRKYYFIQGLETWDGPKERVIKTWKMPFKKIVIARWLQEYAYLLGEDAVCIPNGINLSAFGVDKPINERYSSRLMMLYHHAEWKGSRYGLEAVEYVRREYPDLALCLFGAYRRPKNLPSWITYHQNPQQGLLRNLYNSASIFVAPSLAEGWPLPPAEAMRCGCAVVCTDIEGHREYAMDGETALIAPARDSIALGDHIKDLVKRVQKRQDIALAGSAFISKFTWERAIMQFEETIEQHPQSS